jgi:hypothetical protein
MASKTLSLSVLRTDLPSLMRCSASCLGQPNLGQPGAEICVTSSVGCVDYGWMARLHDIVFDCHHPAVNDG